MVTADEKAKAGTSLQQLNAQKYVQTHKIEEFWDETFNELLKDKPDKPFMVGSLVDCGCVLVIRYLASSFHSISTVCLELLIYYWFSVLVPLFVTVSIFQAICRKIYESMTDEEKAELPAVWQSVSGGK